MLVGGYTFYNTHWPNDSAAPAGNTIDGGHTVGSGHLMGGESLLRRRLSDSTVYGKFLHIILHILFFER